MHSRCDNMFVEYSLYISYAEQHNLNSMCKYFYYNTEA